jgi:hypothetical protein
LLGLARHRAKVQNLPFNIELNDIVVPAVCPLLRVPLVISTGHMSPNSPSLDKIVPALGYVKGNVRVISFKANTMKSNASLEEMELLVNNWKALAA